jgi:putative ABC transport system permease protein
MTRATVVRRSLAYYWRGNVAVVMGVATSVAVLAGALLVGESVRGTLRDLALSRLGATDVVVMAPGFFREALASDLQADAAFVSSFSGVAPLIMFEGFVTVQTTGRRAGKVRVYGVDDRFWQFHGMASAKGLADRQAYISPALAEETGAAVGAPILVRVELPSDIPLESLHGRKDDPGRSLRATVQRVLPPDELGEFSLSPEQGRIRAVFVPLGRVQIELEVGNRVNTLVVATRAGPTTGPLALTPILRRLATIEDAGLTLRALPVEHTLVLGADSGLIDRPRVGAATRALAATDLRAEPVFTYLANTIRINAREVPYSLVAARELSTMLGNASASAIGAVPPIVLNAWSARELGARVGDTVGLDYYIWEDPGRLVTRSAEFRLAAVVPIAPGDRDLAPVYPGITDSPALDDWDPPFPLDLKRVRPVDEEYWKQHRTTPKAFIGIEDGQRLWGSRYGNVTSLRVRSAPGPSGSAGTDLESVRQRFGAALRAELDPLATGMVVRDVRVDAVAASAGVTDFGQYFVYFSFFLVVSALVLSALFFKLGVEQRAREVGLFGAVGASPGFIRRLLLTEAGVLSILGSAIGAPGAVGYAALIVHLLRTRWVDAVGTTALTLHVSPWPLMFGALGGTAAALLCTWLALRGLGAISDRALLAGELTRGAVEEAGSGRGRPGRWLWIALAGAAAALALVAAGRAGAIGQAGAFFGAAFMMLLGGLSAVSYWYRRPSARVLQGRGWMSMVRLGLRNAAARPSRSALSITVVAAATFILIAVDAFRKDAVVDIGPASGLGGYGLVVESLLPIAHDLSTPVGREAIGLTGLDDVRFEPFRLRPGDDTSCLNLYQPTNPRILGVRDTFVKGGRFAFSRSLAETDAERANPWLLLSRTFPDGAIPVIADANSLAYVLHKSLGDDIEVQNGAATVRLRVVAALADSLFQREVLVADSAFVRAFPEEQGYRFLLAEAPAGRAPEVAAAIEDRLATFGADVTSSADRLAQFHRVENTYLATFQMLGGLGLLLGTVGLATVLLRNVLERRRELALFGAVGFRPHHVRLMLLSETVSLLVAGLVIGAAAAAVATVPALLERGGRAPISMTGVLLIAAVLAAGTLTTVLAARAATRQPLLDALRSE